jgi:hypothetical protein
MAEMNRRRHQHRCFPAGVSKHQALVACAFILVSRRINALSDINGLSMKIAFERQVFPMEPVLFIPYFPDCVPRQFFQKLGVDLAVRVHEAFRTADFARQNDAVRRA